MPLQNVALEPFGSRRRPLWQIRLSRNGTCTHCPEV